MNKLLHALLGFLALLMISGLVYAGLTNQPGIGLTAACGLFGFSAGFCFGSDQKKPLNCRAGSLV